MIQMTLIIECSSTEESKEIAYLVQTAISSDVSSFEVISNEEYWKVSGQYRITLNLETSETIDIKKAEDILYKVSNKWEWSRASAHSCSNTMNAKFLVSKIKFATVRFEDLS